jgi:hypothetical protein
MYPSKSIRWRCPGAGQRTGLRVVRQRAVPIPSCLLVGSPSALVEFGSNCPISDWLTRTITSIFSNLNAPWQLRVIGPAPQPCDATDVSHIAHSQVRSMLSPADWIGIGIAWQDPTRQKRCGRSLKVKTVNLSSGRRNKMRAYTLSKMGMGGFCEPHSQCDYRVATT